MSDGTSPIRDALARCRAGFVGAILVSLMLNLLMLTGPFYMLQIYDRILPAHSIPTLIGISLLALLLFAAYGALEFVRTRLMTRLASVLDLRLADMAFDAETNAMRRQQADGLEALRDLGVVRQFLASPAATGLMDVPWLPIYVAFIYMLHPLIGWIAVASSILFIAIAALNEVRGRPLSRGVDALRRREELQAGDVRNNIDSVRAMGMRPSLKARWHGLHGELVESAAVASDRNASYSTLSKTLRLILQSAILGVGAYLVVINELSAGSLIAASIIFARALAPIDQAVAQWRMILAARQSWSRLTRSEGTAEPAAARMPLPTPTKNLAVTGLSVGTSGRVLLHDLTFRLEAGDAMGLIGPSGIGKTSLIRTLTGAIAPAGGEIRLDDATPDQWDESTRGRHVGYLAQDVQLLEGTLAQNIARFRSDATAEQVIAAATLVGLNPFILSLPEGYNTVLGQGGIILSAGQRQRIGMARAVFDLPFLIALDEPNAHLDTYGEAALAAALRELRAAKRIVVVAAHRPSVLAEVNKLLLLEPGQPAVFGNRDEILAHMAANKRQPEQQRGFHVVGA